MAGTIAAARRLRADGLHVKRDRDLAGLFEFERDRYLVALLQRGFFRSNIIR
ncbi:hypothetical protein ACVJH7_009507 [Bradyrhizobium elkanii]